MSDNKNHQISIENSDPAHDFYEAISVKNGGKQILLLTSENRKSIKHLGKINLEKQYQRSISVSF